MSRLDDARRKVRREHAERNGRAGRVHPDDEYPKDQRGDAWEPPPSSGESALAPPDDASLLPIYQRMSDVKARPVEWLWRPWLPRGAITILDGDPGEGKSTLAIDLAARATRAWRMPPQGGADAERRPADVLLLSAEDSPETTIRPRLDLAGADAARVVMLAAIKTGDGERPPVLPFDMELVAGKIERERIQLLVIDPFMAFLDGAIDSHRDQDVRRCLHVLKQIAERTNAAILIIRHLNKTMGGSALYRGGGSIGITGACRSALIVGRDPGNASRHVLAMNKTNLAKKPRSLVYGIEELNEVSRIGWLEECDLTADDILERPRGSRQGMPDRRAEAMRELLTDREMETNELNDKLESMAYSQAAIKRARVRLKVKSHRVGFGPEGRWMMHLPNQP